MTGSIALFAPAVVRRSKKRLAAYEQKHAELRREVREIQRRRELHQIKSKRLWPKWVWRW